MGVSVIGIALDSMWTFIFKQIFLVTIECRVFGPGGYSSYNVTVKYSDSVWTNVLKSSILGAGSFLSAVLIIGLGLFIWSRCYRGTYERPEDDQITRV